MKKLTIAVIGFSLFFLTSCGVKKEGLVIMTDPSYKATMFATTKVGFGSPDGLLWHKGKLYLADEGGVAIETYSRSEGIRKLADADLRSEEHTSELQSRLHLVCRLLLEK